MSDEPIEDYLRRLHEEYVRMTNTAVDGGRLDLAESLGDAYTDEALRAITDDGAGPAKD